MIQNAMTSTPLAGQNSALAGRPPRKPRRDRATETTPASVRRLCQWAGAIVAAAHTRGALAAPASLGGHAATYTNSNGSLFGVHAKHSAFWDPYIFRQVQHACDADRSDVPFNASWPQIATATYFNGNRAGIIAHVGEVYAPDPGAISDTYKNCVTDAMNAGNGDADAAVWGLAMGLGLGGFCLLAGSAAACLHLHKKRKKAALQREDLALADRLGAEVGK